MAHKEKNEFTDEMLEEYRICRSTSRELEGNVYRTATIFGIGSAAAIAVVTQGFGALATSGGLAAVERLLIVALATALALAGWLTWWRMAERWRSVAWAMIIRMRHIERTTGMRANLYVAALDDYKEMETKNRPGARRRVEFVDDAKSSDFERPYLDAALEKNLQSFVDQHEYRGIRPMIGFLVRVNISAWVLLFAWHVFSEAMGWLQSRGATPCDDVRSVLALIAVASIAFLVFLRAQWRKP